MKEGYKSIEDILKEVGEEEGMSLREMTDIWKHQKAYINKKQEEEGVYAIFIPYIGTLSLNVKQYIAEVRYKNRSYYKDFTEKINKLKSDIRYVKYSNAHKKVIGVHRLIKYIAEKFETEKNLRKWIASKAIERWELIAKYSNNKL
ncbi:MAG: rubrerythrin [Flavobacteriaceae bacterium]